MGERLEERIHILEERNIRIMQQMASLTELFAKLLTDLNDISRSWPILMV